MEGVKKPIPPYVVAIGTAVVTNPAFAQGARVVYEGPSKKAAKRLFQEFRRNSAQGLGDDALLEVAMRHDGEPVKAYVPPY